MEATLCGGREAAATMGVQAEKTLEIAGVTFELGSLDPRVSRDEMIEIYWAQHPRFIFLKQVRAGGAVLDVGAGPGGLVHWKAWGRPVRNDLRMLAVDRTKGQFFDMYTGFVVTDLDASGELGFPAESIDAFVLSHVLEHIEGVDRLLAELARLARPLAQIYVEVPTPASLTFPRRSQFEQRGLKVSTVNFFDDDTHRRTFSLQEISIALAKAGFSALESGVIQNPFLQDRMLAAGVQTGDVELTTYAVWSKLRFAHYIKAEKPASVSRPSSPP